MSKIGNVISNIVSVLWFFGVILWTLLIMIFVFLIVIGDIKRTITTGFSSSAIGGMYMLLFGIVFFITGVVPPFRRCFYKYPWLHPFVTIYMMDLGILSLVESIIVKGYEVMSTPRHVISIILALAVLIGGRLLMCLYLKKRPVAINRNYRMQ